MLVGTDAEKPPYPVLEGAWIDSAHPEKRGAVIGKTTAEQMNLKLGDEALVIYGTKEYRLKIVGLIEEGPSQMGMGRRMRAPGSTAPRTGIEAGPASSAVYVPLALAQHFTRGKAKVNLIHTPLKPDAKSQAAQFRKTWEGRIAQSRPLASLLGVDLADAAGAPARGVTVELYGRQFGVLRVIILIMVLLAVANTINMSTFERVGEFGTMRALGNRGIGPHLPPEDRQRMRLEARPEIP